MQSKGAIKLVAILIGLACLYQLSFTAVTYLQENKAEKYAEDAVLAVQQTPSFSKVSELDKAFYLDSLRKEKNRYYIDSISTEKVYLGFTFKEVKEKEINLGLDLKGGMNVMLQVELSDLVVALSDNNTSAQFTEALALAKKNQRDSRSDFITLFAEAWDVVAPGERLSSVFATYEMREKIKPESTNEEVISVIREEAESAVANSFNVLRNRIDRFGVASPNIQKLGNSGRILVELPGVKEPERVRKLLQGTASLEFWPTYEAAEVFGYMQEANNILREYLSSDDEVVEEKAAPASDDLLAQATQEDSLSLDETNYAKNNPLFYALQPSIYNGQVMPGPMVGVAHYKDTAAINSWLELPQIKSLFPRDLKLMWTVKPSEQYANDSYFELIAIKANTRDGKAPLDGGAVADARMSYANTGGTPEVDMSMNAEGSRVWARLTADNIGKCIAIALDGTIYSYPRVNQEITGGRSAITGNFTIEEAEDLANVLKSGKLPAPASIVQEQVVGPSLGSESISAGIISILVAFVLVLVYIAIFYNGAGLVANVALLCNVIFLLGTLASFGAVLTLPGMAGIVLTMGMAVDANVIIYERIKEELRAGKALRLAVADGYKNAYSAIIDGNLTTIITGIVLMAFGSGPVQGFATTLVIGIITSMFTSIFITRLIFEARMAKNKGITFDNKATRNFLKNTKIDFLGMRKWSYIFSIVCVVICLGSIFIKGFSYGVDFTGGRTYVVRFDQPVSAEEVRVATTAEFGESVEVKQFGGESQMKVTTKYMIDDNSSETDVLVDGKLYNALKGYFATPLSFEDFTSTVDNPNGIISSDKVGPTIANDIKRNAVIAVIIALFAIFVYIAARFRNWTYGLGGVVALVHDAIIAIGFFSLFTGVLPFTLDVDQTFIAAILTIIGYSINDNVVIFDRIRENNMLYPKRDLGQNVNEALNSTLSRTVNTSLSTLVTLIAIALFGGEVIRGFAVALIVGIVFGTYSSVFIGTPLMFDMTTRKAKKAALKK
ncbi:MAG: protein translocase subunit SecDF [Bacteroidales bacterium]|nr:protein translocase subunit SecDF [Bacteroidales bacterium]